MAWLLTSDPVTGYRPIECIVYVALLGLVILAMCLAYGSAP